MKTAEPIITPHLIKLQSPAAWRATLGLMAVVILSASALFASPVANDVMRLVTGTELTPTGVDAGARGNINVIMTQHGNALDQRVEIQAVDLQPNTAYELNALNGNAAIPTGIASLITDKRGAINVTYEENSQGKQAAHTLPLPAALDPICAVRELDLLNSDQATVLRGILGEPGRGNYLVKRSMDKTGFLPAAQGALDILVDSHSSRFSLTASGLAQRTVYSLMINGDIIRSATSDKTGGLTLSKLPMWAPDLLDIHLVALADGGGNNVVLTADGLGVPCETAPPTVSFTMPVDMSTNVPLNSQVTATFSAAMNPATINSTTFILQQGGTPVSGLVSYANGTATFTPATSLLADTIYTATITTGAMDLAGNALAASLVWSFTTGAAPDTMPPTVSSTTPADTATGVPVNRRLSATFSEAINPATLSDATFTLQQGGTSVTGMVSYVGGTAIFAPATALLTNAPYTATITTGVTDLAGNALASDFVWSFTTGATPDTTAPTVSSTTPVDTSTNVPVNSQVTATFSMAMNPATITDTTFTLQQGGASVTGMTSYANGTASFAPATALLTDVLYTATITTGAMDLAGNALAGNFVWTFTTSSSTDTNPPTVISSNPTNTSANVAINQTVNVTFSKAMDAATISTANFTVTGPAGTNLTGTVSYLAASEIATFTPAANLDPNTTYTNTILTGVKDQSGNALATNFVWTFTTGTQADTNNMSIPLGAASGFAIMATAATSGGADQINGDVGLSPGTAQGIPPSEINGTVHVNDQAVKDAQASLLAAYNQAVNRSVNAQSLPGDLGGLTLTPGLYSNGSSTGISGTGANAILTLDAQGDANAVFVFKMASTLVTDSGTSIVLAGGAQAKNIYWQVGSSATLGTTSIFKGNILAFVTITVKTGAAVDGRLFAGSGGDASGAVTVQSSTVTVPAP